MTACGWPACDVPRVADAAGTHEVGGRQPFLGHGWGNRNYGHAPAHLLPIFGPSDTLSVNRRFDEEERWAVRLEKNDHDHPEKETLDLPVPGHLVVGLCLDLHRVYVRRDPRRERNHKEIPSTHAWTGVDQALLWFAPRQYRPESTHSIKTDFPS